jgi:hypothetical protein
MIMIRIFLMREAKNNTLKNLRKFNLIIFPNSMRTTSSLKCTWMKASHKVTRITQKISQVQLRLIVINK